ncbi:hypothetical protein PMIN06_001053 [Paraphaeosphaeria minitans]
MWLFYSPVAPNFTVTRAISAAFDSSLHPSPIPFATICSGLMYTIIYNLIQISDSNVSFIFTAAALLLKVTLHILDILAYIKCLHFILIRLYRSLSDVDDVNDCKLIITFLTPWGVGGVFVLVGMKCAMLVLLVSWYVCSVSEHVDDYVVFGVGLVGFASLGVGKVCGGW